MATQANHELARESLLCMSGHAKCLPEANLGTIHSAVCHLQPALQESRDRQTHTMHHSSESVPPMHST